MRRLMPFLVLPALVGAPARAQMPPTSLASPATFSGFNDWLGSDLQGVRVGADGRIRLAPHVRRVAQVPEGVIWCAVPDGSGGFFLSAGTEGRLFHYTGGSVKPLGQVKGGIVFAMARVGQDLVVAPSGEGKLFRVTPGGDVKPFADIDARLVWAMSATGSELTLAAGGERGAVLLLAREGTSRKLAELPEETAFTCMIPDGQGGLYLGTHGRGLVVRYRADRLETLFASGFEEIRALAQRGGDLFVGASTGVANRYASGSLEAREGYLAAPGVQTRGAVFRLDGDGVPATLWQSAQDHVYALALRGDQLLVGTGNRSRLFALPATAGGRDREPFAVLGDVGTGQATALLPAGSDLMVVASNPAELHLLSDTQATAGTLESRILKGAPLADWGRSYLDADIPAGTGVELQFRSGATETPDGSWSPWSPPLRSGERPNLKPSRFAQFRLRLTSSRGGATPAVEGVRVHWANRNLAPMWEGMEIMPPGLVITRTAPPDDIGIERVPLETQKLIPALGYAGAEKRSFRRGAQAFVFRVSDPNGDALAFNIRLMPEQGGPIELARAWRERFFTFDTLPVPDGRYRLEVEASDEPSQPINGAERSTWRTATFTVDHTPPTISEVSALAEGDNLRVRFVARDAASALKEAALSADGEHWLQVAPDDRVFDHAEERFEVVIPRSRVKGDRLVIRAVDQNGNEAAASAPLGEAGRKR
ncbi:MAG: hypothetical protein BWY56_02241 [Acidobacteria bacterium ADurb.Bin340]|nr:MAG: hypothetical protein BWY56_02241 [Acidobacteria bacterium ADurb.Bin340]HQL47133.1 hypothetical protein [Holophaga sp.]